MINPTVDSANSALDAVQNFVTRELARMEHSALSVHDLVAAASYGYHYALIMRDNCNLSEDTRERWANHAEAMQQATDVLGAIDLMLKELPG